MTSISCRFLLFARMFSRELDKHIFQGRPDFVNFRMANASTAQLFVNLCALDTFIDKQMHRLTKHRRAAHARKLMHRMESRRHMIAHYIEPSRPRRKPGDRSGCLQPL